jgi:hypothetical protein
MTRFTQAEVDRLNEGREQGKRPYPIIRHCYFCDKSVADEHGVRHADENVSDDDEVFLEDDSESGLTFTPHVRCSELQPDVDEAHAYIFNGGWLH